MIHQRTHPSLDVEGCYGCRISGIHWGAVPGGTRPGGRAKRFLERRERGLIKYAERRKAGEQPDGTTLEKIEAYDKRMDTYQRMEKDLREDNPKERVDQLERSISNTSNRRRK